MAPFGKLGIWTLGKAVADDAVGPVVGVIPHAEGRRECPDLFFSEVICALEGLVRQTVIQSTVEIKYLSQHIKAAHKAVINILLYILQRRLVRHGYVPGEDQDRIIDAHGHFHAAESRLVLQEFRILQLDLFPQLGRCLFVIIAMQQLLNTLLCLFGIDRMFGTVDR